MQAAIEDRLRGGGAERPHFVGGAEWQRILADPLQHAGQTDVREERRLGDADQRVLFLHGALSLRDIGPPFEQGRGNCHRGARRRAGQVVMADGQFGGRAADQHGDGVFVLRAQHAGIDFLRLRGFELGLCRGHIAARYRITGVELILHDLKRALVFLDRAGEEIVQGIHRQQIEIGGGEQGLLGQFDVGEIGGARLRRSRIGLICRRTLPQTSRSQVPFSDGV